jgi:hypothetical protein
VQLRHAGRTVRIDFFGSHISHLDALTEVRPNYPETCFLHR